MLLPGIIYLIWNVLIHLTDQSWMTLRILLIMNSCCSQTHGLVKKGAEVIEAFGLSFSYYVPSLWRVIGVRVGSQNHNPQMLPSKVNL